MGRMTASLGSKLRSRSLSFETLLSGFHRFDSSFE
jgi:hypothetical protein